MDQNTHHETAPVIKRNRGGAKPKPPEVLLIKRSICFNCATLAKIDRAGLTALRKLLDEWDPEPGTIPDSRSKGGVK